MVSFIVIGRNEEKNLKRCFNSIYNAISFSGIKFYEIIYVDSQSTDNSINVSKCFNEIRVFKIMGTCNAAIARNIGAEVSKGDVLYFIDADMAISKDFLLTILDRHKNLQYPFVSGELTDIIDGSAFKRDMKQFLGGIFLIKKEIWKSMNGMRSKYKTGEDIDLGLRLFKKGFKLNRIPEVVAEHYTVNLMEKSKIWRMLWDKSVFYTRSVLYRDHLFNKQMYYVLWSNDKTFIILFLTFISLIIFKSASIYLILIYFTFVIFRSIKQIKFISFFECLLYYFLLDTLTIFYLFTFFPKSKKHEYIALNERHHSKSIEFTG